MPGKPRDDTPEPQPKAGNNEPLVARPRVKSLSKNVVMVLLIGAFLTLGFLAMRFSRDGASAVAPTAPSTYAVPGVEPGQLEDLADRLTLARQQAVARRQPPPPPVAAPPQPLPQPVTPIVRQRGVFEVPMAPQSARRSYGAGPDVSALVPPSFQLPPGELAQLQALAGGTGQQERTGFLPEGDASGALILQPRPAHPYQLRRGSFLPVVLSHPINTDVPGLIRAHLARDVRDATGRHLLLPQGTVVVGQQRGRLSGGDSRLLIDWYQVQLPDGRTLELPEPQGTAAVDGSLGATGKVDRHFGSRFGTALMLGVLGASLQLSQPQSFPDSRATFGQGASARQVAAGEVGARLNDLAERTLEDRLDRPPTIRIPAGARLHLLLLNDLVFPPPRPGMKSPGYAQAPDESGFRKPGRRPGVPQAGLGSPCAGRACLSGWEDREGERVRRPAHGDSGPATTTEPESELQQIQ